MSTITALFKKYDEDGDSTIDTVEFRRLFKVLDPQVWNDTKLDKLFCAVDANKSGRIDYREFCRWVLGETLGHQVFDKETLGAIDVSGHLSSEWHGKSLLLVAGPLTVAQVKVHLMKIQATDDILIFEGSADLHELDNSLSIGGDTTGPACRLHAAQRLDFEAWLSKSPNVCEMLKEWEDVPIQIRRLGYFPGFVWTPDEMPGDCLWTGGNIETLLEEQLRRTQSMMSSNGNVDDRRLVSCWDTCLHKTKKTFKLLLHLYNYWFSLVGWFNGEDAKRQLPMESVWFARVDLRMRRLFEEILKSPAALPRLSPMSKEEGCRSELEELQETMGLIVKGLHEFANDICEFLPCLRLLYSPTTSLQMRLLDAWSVNWHTWHFDGDVHHNIFMVLDDWVVDYDRALCQISCFRSRTNAQVVKLDPGVDIRGCDFWGSSYPALLKAQQQFFQNRLKEALKDPALSAMSLVESDLPLQFVAVISHLNFTALVEGRMQVLLMTWQSARLVATTIGGETVVSLRLACAEPCMADLRSLLSQELQVSASTLRFVSSSGISLEDEKLVIAGEQIAVHIDWKSAQEVHVDKKSCKQPPAGWSVKGLLERVEPTIRSEVRELTTCIRQLCIGKKDGGVDHTREQQMLSRKLEMRAQYMLSMKLEQLRQLASLCKTGATVEDAWAAWQERCRFYLCRSTAHPTTADDEGGATVVDALNVEVRCGDARLPHALALNEQGFGLYNHEHARSRDLLGKDALGRALSCLGKQGEGLLILKGSPLQAAFCVLASDLGRRFIDWKFDSWTSYAYASAWTSYARDDIGDYSVEGQSSFSAVNGHDAQWISHFSSLLRIPGIFLSIHVTDKSPKNLIRELAKELSRAITGSAAVVAFCCAELSELEWLHNEVHAIALYEVLPWSDGVRNANEGRLARLGFDEFQGLAAAVNPICQDIKSLESASKATADAAKELYSLHPSEQNRHAEFRVICESFMKANLLDEHSEQLLGAS